MHAATYGSPSWILLLLGLGILFALIALLSNPTTRGATVAVLGGLIVLVMLLAIAWLFVAIPVRVQHTAQHEGMRWESVGPPERVYRQQGEQATGVPPQVTLPAAPPVPEVIPQPPPRAEASVWRAMVRAVANSLDPDHKPPEKATAVTAPEEKSPPPVTTAAKETVAAPLAKMPEPKPLPYSVESEVPAPVRPPWVDARPLLKDDRYCMTAFTKPYTTLQERENETAEVLRASLAEYVRMYLGKEAAQGLHWPVEDLNRQIVREHWDEPVEPPIGMDEPLTRRHFRLEFDAKMQEKIKDEWLAVQHRSLVNSRLWQAGAMLGGVLTLLAVVFGYLKIDEATRGAYRKRMGLATTLLVVVAIALVAMVS